MLLVGQRECCRRRWRRQWGGDFPELARGFTRRRLRWLTRRCRPLELVWIVKWLLLLWMIHLRLRLGQPLLLLLLLLQLWVVGAGRLLCCLRRRILQMRKWLLLPRLLPVSADWRG